jgi:beta-lactam-binding protein with PASTA domain
MGKRLFSLMFVVVCFCLCWSSVAKAGSAVLPCVVGESQSAAVSNLNASGFQVITITSSFSETVALGSVDSENPQCGATYDTGDVITISVSQGSLALAGAQVFGVAFSGILYAFALGLFFGLFVKMTNRS